MPWLVGIDFTIQTVTHPLLDVMLDAARGKFPAVDGAVTFLPELPGGNRAIVALTGHAFIAADLVASDFGDIKLDGFGATLAPAAVVRVAGDGEIGVNDVTLVATGTGRGTKSRVTTAWDDHPRVRHARRLRTNVTVYGDDGGFFTLSNGLAGRMEMSIEITDTGTSTGNGRRLIRDAVGGVPDGQYLFAAVSPGNARSLRSFLAAGFLPIGSEVVIDRSSLRSTTANSGVSTEPNSDAEPEPAPRF